MLQPLLLGGDEEVDSLHTAPSHMAEEADMGWGSGHNRTEGQCGGSSHSQPVPYAIYRLSTLHSPGERTRQQPSPPTSGSE